MYLLMILLIVLLVLAFAGSGYGYYRGGAYASPMGVLAVILLIGLVVWLSFGGWPVYPPPP
jgi:hypothetical protein